MHMLKYLLLELGFLHHYRMEMHSVSEKKLDCANLFTCMFLKHIFILDLTVSDSVLLKQLQPCLYFNVMYSTEQ